MAVLGSQRLTELRDVIQCEADANMRAKAQQRPSAFFYIEVTVQPTHICACCAAEAPLGQTNHAKPHCITVSVQIAAPAN